MRNEYYQPLKLPGVFSIPSVFPQIIWVLYFHQPSHQDSLNTHVQLIIITQSSYVLHSCRKHWINEDWSTAPGGNRFLWTSGYIFFNWLIQNLVLCMFLFKDTLIYICVCVYGYNSFTLQSQPTALWLMPEQSLSNTNITAF